MLDAAAVYTTFYAGTSTSTSTTVQYCIVVLAAGKKQNLAIIPVRIFFSTRGPREPRINRLLQLATRSFRTFAFDTHQLTVARRMKSTMIHLHRRFCSVGREPTPRQRQFVSKFLSIKRHHTNRSGIDSSHRRQLLRPETPSKLFDFLLQVSIG